MLAPKWQWLLLAVVVLIIAYIYQYYRYPVSSGILQTDMEGFSWEMLFSRQPVFLDAAVPDPTDLLKVWFGRTLLAEQSQGEDWVRNRCKYKVFYHPGGTETAELLLAPPGSSSKNAAIALLVPAYALVIVPFHWSTSGAGFWEYGYHDLITRFLP